MPGSAPCLALRRDQAGKRRRPCVREGMAYQVSKEIGRALAALKGRAGVIALTGPGGFRGPPYRGIEERVSKWGPVIRVPQDDCTRGTLVREGLSAIAAKRFLRYPEEKRS